MSQGRITRRPTEQNCKCSRAAKAFTHTTFTTYPMRISTKWPSLKMWATCRLRLTRKKTISINFKKPCYLALWRSWPRAQWQKTSAYSPSLKKENGKMSFRRSQILPCLTNCKRVIRSKTTRLAPNDPTTKKVICTSECVSQTSKTFRKLTVLLLMISGQSIDDH